MNFWGITCFYPWAEWDEEFKTVRNSNTVRNFWAKSRKDYQSSRVFELSRGTSIDSTALIPQNGHSSATREEWIHEYIIYSNNYFDLALWKYRRHGHVPSLSIFCRRAGLAELAFNSSSSDFNSAAVFLEFVAEINSLIAQAVWK